MSTIIFGTKRLGKSAVVSSVKYADRAVVTVEGEKGAKKSRRILFNKLAAELLGFEAGEIQTAVFGSLVAEDGNTLLITNAGTIAEDDSRDMTVYKTSKNNVSFDDSNEKGKAITSSHMCNEISNFLDLDNKTTEFELASFDSDELEAFAFVTMTEPSIIEEVPFEAAAINEVDDQPLIETNSGEMNGEELVNSIQNEVAAAEEANPVLAEEEAEETVFGLGTRKESVQSEAWMETAN